MRPSVLLVDKDSSDAERTSQLLTRHGYDVRTAASSEIALNSIEQSRPALVLAELDMPEIDGLDLCRRLSPASTTPVILMSSDDSVHAEVAALEAGADDYIRKPFQTESLLARVKLALRRSGGTGEASVVGVGPFHIDFNDRRVRVHGQAVRLTPKEFDLFTFMARHPNRVLPHKTLLGAVWGGASEEQSEYLRVFMGQLRKKLETDPSNPRYLLTEPWVGYRFNPSGSQPS
jgi:two-component system KDP operon response regulator KdpE